MVWIGNGRVAFQPIRCNTLTCAPSQADPHHTRLEAGIHWQYRSGGVGDDIMTEEKTWEPIRNLTNCLTLVGRNLQNPWMKNSPIDRENRRTLDQCKFPDERVHKLVSEWYRKRLQRRRCASFCCHNILSKYWTKVEASYFGHAKNVLVQINEWCTFAVAV